MLKCVTFAYICHDAHNGINQLTRTVDHSEMTDRAVSTEVTIMNGAKVKRVVLKCGIVHNELGVVHGKLSINRLQSDSVLYSIEPRPFVNGRISLRRYEIKHTISTSTSFHCRWEVFLKVVLHV